MSNNKIKIFFFTIEIKKKFKSIKKKKKNINFNKNIFFLICVINKIYNNQFNVNILN